MTDNEIMQALECCGTDMNCHRCPAKEDENGCIRKTCQNALDLINHQKAELENQSENFKKLVAEHRKLQTDYSSMQSTLAKMSMGVEQAKAEAIKEFAERLNDKAFHDMNDGEAIVCCCDIDNLVKEMVGDAE